MHTTDGNIAQRVAVVGCGAWGKNLVRNYDALGVLEMVCDDDPERARTIAAQYGDLRATSSFDDVLSDENVTAVVVATPAEHHFRIAKDALLRGKHVYVEKPLALREADGEELVQLAAQQNRMLMVGHLLQYHPAYIRLKELVANGELGRINYMYSHRLNLGKIRSEENILWSFAPHDISMILALAGEEPESVYATGGNYLHKRIADVTTTHLRFPSGIKAHIHVSWLHPYKEQNLVVIGDKKMAVFNDLLEWDKKLCLYAHEIRWNNGVPVADKANPEYVDLPQFEPLRAECEHFLDCIVNERNPRTDGQEGLRVLGVLNASQESMDQDG